MLGVENGLKGRCRDDLGVLNLEGEPMVLPSGHLHVRKGCFRFPTNEVGSTGFASHTAVFSTVGDIRARRLENVEKACPESPDVRFSESGANGSGDPATHKSNALSGIGLNRNPNVFVRPPANTGTELLQIPAERNAWPGW